MSRRCARADVARPHEGERPSRYLHKTKIKKWDICAGDALLRAGGGMMTDWDGRDFEYGADSDPLNDKGVLAALRGHGRFQNKFQEGHGKAGR